jgi:hypothetical protein
MGTKSAAICAIYAIAMLLTILTFAVSVLSLAYAAYHAPWHRLKDKRLQHVFLGAGVMLLLLWSMRARVGSGRHGDFAWVGVDDPGPGIDPRDHAAVFQRDWSGDRSSLREERRTGLGLAIARQIAQAHGGLLTLRSVRGAGAAFVMWLPLAPGADRDELSDDGVHALHDPFVDPD